MAPIHGGPPEALRLMETIHRNLEPCLYAYDQVAPGEMKNLPKPSVDTHGLNVAAVLQGVHDN